MKHLQHIGILIFVITLAFASGALRAQGAPDEHQSYMVGGWELNEVFHSDGTLMGFWGIPTSQLSVGNIRRIWFKAKPAGEWDVYAFEPVNALSKADDLLLDGMSDESIIFFRWREHLAKEKFVDEDVNGGTQGFLYKGFISGDPLTETVALLSDPTPMIDLLANVSYPIAPGMTEMLVTGTAGATVNMNAATKQMLNCLRNTSSTSCGGCVCDVTSESDQGSWQIARSVDNGIIRCDYTRITIHTFWQSGLYPEDCTDCTVGSADDPETYVQVEESSVILAGGLTECPPTP